MYLAEIIQVIVVDTNHFSMYRCADDNVAESVVDKFSDVVIWLTSPHFDTSVPSAIYLYSHRTYLSGTDQPNRCGLPEPVKQKLAKQSDAVSYRRGPL